MKRITIGVGLFLVAALFAFAGGSKEQAGQPATASGGKIGGSTTVLGPWGGSELDIFNSMIKPFEDKTGIQVQYEGTRDADAILTTRSLRETRLMSPTSRIPARCGSLPTRASSSI